MTSPTPASSARRPSRPSGSKDRPGRLSARASAATCKRNGKGPTYWTKCTVTECEPGKVFAFGVDGRPGGQPVNTWRYEFAPSGDGADVTESFTLSNMLPMRLYWMVMGRLRGRTNVNGMRTTLERIKAVVEA